MDKWTDFFQNYVNDFVKTGYEKLRAHQNGE